MKFKKGISGVVATVLILLITVVAAGLLISFILPFIQNNLASSSECLAYRDYLKFAPEIGYTCYDSAGLHAFSVRAQTLVEQTGKSQQRDNATTVIGNASAIGTGNNAVLRGFSVVFTRTGLSSKVDTTTGTQASSAIGGVRLLDRTITPIAVPRDGEVQTYVYNAGEERYEEIEIYPVLNSGKLCEKTDTIKISPCKGGTNLSP